MEFRPTVRCVLCAALAGLALSAAPAPALARGTLIYATGFDDAPVGTVLAGQGGWVAPGLFSPGAAVFAKGPHVDGKQGIRVRGRGLEPQDFILQLTEGYYQALGSYRHAVNY